MSTITLGEPMIGRSRHPDPRLAPEPGHVVPRGDDEHLAFLLVATWSLRTGRRLRHAPPELLTEAELLEFWADPDCAPRRGAPTGTRPGGPPAEGARDAASGGGRRR